MKKISISEEEAKAIIRALKANWIPQDDQKIVYELIFRLEKELQN